MKRVVLASASPRRRELLSLVGVDFEVLPSTGEEICNETEPAGIVEALPCRKRKIRQACYPVILSLSAQILLSQRMGRFLENRQMKGRHLRCCQSCRGQASGLFGGCACVGGT